jgi:hypothetical protein
MDFLLAVLVIGLLFCAGVAFTNWEHKKQAEKRNKGLAPPLSLEPPPTPAPWNDPRKSIGSQMAWGFAYLIVAILLRVGYVAISNARTHP